MRHHISQLISNLTPHDALETTHIQDTLTWIKSGAPIFRIQKPATPPQHLVSYFLLLDETTQKVLLVDHIKSGLWLPCGGHVEQNEDPRDAAARECEEELGIKADFWHPEPLFLTSTLTVGLTAGHTDVSLWYVLKGDHSATYAFDREEFKSIRWYGFDEIPYPQTDPHMGRFMEKLTREMGG